MPKRIPKFITAAVLIAVFAFALTSCEKHGIYKLAETILSGNRQDQSVEKFEAEFDIKIKKESPEDPLPDKINLQIDGEFYHLAGSRVLCSAMSVNIEGYYLEMYVQDEALYFEAGETAELILDLLTASGFVGTAEAKILKETVFDGKDEKNPKILRIGLKNFDLTQLDRNINNAFKIENPKFLTVTDLTPGSVAHKTFKDYTVLDFDIIKAQVKKELLKLPGYRYSEIFLIIEPEPGQNKNNFLYVLATCENGGREVLERIKIDADLSKVKNNDSLLSENILPMRYVLELLGETVSWDAVSKRAYILRDGKNLYFEGKLINSKTYINVFQIILQTDYMITHTDAGDCLEIKITRRQPGK